MGRSVVRWLWHATERRRLQVALLALLQALDGASLALYALFLQRVIDAATQGDAQGFWRSVALLALVVATQVVLRALIRRLGELCRATLENAFKARLMRHLLHADLQAVGAQHSAEWLNRLTNDTVVVANGCALLLPGLAGTTARLASALAMLTVLDARLATVLLPAGAALVAFAHAFRVALKRLHRAIQEADGRLRVTLQEHLSSLLIIRSFAAEKSALAVEHSRMEAHKNARMRKNLYANLCSLGYGTAMNGLYLLGVAWCGHAMLRGIMSFGTLTAILQLMSRIQAPLGSMSGYLPQYYSLVASAERLQEAESLPQGVCGSPLGARPVARFYQRELRSFGLRNVTFLYEGRGANPAMRSGVRNVSLEVAKGDFVAFTGRSGCGKSTVLKLLMGAYAPQGGQCYLANADGRTTRLDDRWRLLFAYVPQGNLLMTGTVREVVSLANPSDAHDDARLWEALRVACAHEFVSKLDRQLDATLGERGSGLSEGQMQRLSIARAVFSDRPIVLLDEATSALDERTELAVLGNLRELRHKTVLIVTHRGSVARACARTIHFSEDGVIEQ